MWQIINSLYWPFLHKFLAHFTVKVDFFFINYYLLVYFVLKCVTVQIFGDDSNKSKFNSGGN
jgi:hypothetical protein